MRFQAATRAACPALAPDLFALCLAVGLSACGAEPDAATTLNNPIEGRWLLPNGGDRIQIAPCGATTAAGFCGAFLPSDATSEDLMNPGLIEWGRPLDGVQIVQNLAPGDTAGDYHGSYYLPDLGETLFLDVRQETEDRLAVLIYFGANMEEVADMAINSLFSPVSASDAGWLAIRLAIGREVLGSAQIWVRDKVEGER